MSDCLKVAIIASGQVYQDSAASAASTFSAFHAHSVSVYLPEQEHPTPTLLRNSRSFAFAVDQFPFVPISSKKMTSQLKCQGFVAILKSLSEEDIVCIADADTCCLSPLQLRAHERAAIRRGNIGMVPDIRDYHSQNKLDPWYLLPHEQLTYVNSGVIIASRRALPVFEHFLEVSSRPDFLRGPFNDQKVINYVMGKYYPRTLLILAKQYNRINPNVDESAKILHFAGGAGLLAVQRRRLLHIYECNKVLHRRTCNRDSEIKAAISAC